MVDSAFATSEVPLYTGPFNGFRHFRVTATGHLTGVTYRETWTPGENVATCYRLGWVESGEVTDDEIAVLRSWPEGALPGFRMVGACIAATMTATTRKPLPCKGVALDCECGFWSYHYDEGASPLPPRPWSTFATPDTVTGVVANYGRITTGPKGFRSEKARILALALPGQHQALDEPYRRSATNLSRDVLDKVRANYPGVNTFRSVEAMLEKYPTTPPPPAGGASS